MIDKGKVAKAAGVRLLFIRKLKYIIALLLFLAVGGSAIGIRFYYNKKNNEENKRNEYANVVEASTGVINTDVIEDKNDNYSRYTLGDDFEEVKDEKEEKHNSNTSSSAETHVIDRSSLKGNNLSIDEGTSFNVLKDLNITATDKDGSIITERVSIEKNDVNTNKPGKYSVKASVRLNDGYILEKTFDIYVKSTELDVNILSFESSEYEVEKNSKIVMDLSLKSSKNYVTAKSVIINGEEYYVNKDNNIISRLLNKQQYKVVMNSGSDAGRKEYKLEYLKMSDDTLIKVNNTAEVEVLKSQPKINNFTYTEKKSNKKLKASFALNDIDNAVSNLRMEVYRGNELIKEEKLNKEEKYEIQFPIEKSGIYEFVIKADVSLYVHSSEENIKSDEKIFSESINIKNIDETSLEGESIEISKGSQIDFIKDLKIKAVDVDGEDITNNVVVDKKNFDENTPGKYRILVYIINKNNVKVTREFTITVNNITDNHKERESFFGRLALRSSSSDYSSEIDTASELSARSSNRQVYDVKDGNSVNANVEITGNITKSDGSLADGRIYVEMPTKLSFIVDKGGNLNSQAYVIDNKSSVPVEVSVENFTSMGKKAITINPISKSLENLDRSNIHLRLVGDSVIDLGAPIDRNNKLIEVPALQTQIITLEGEAGTQAKEDVDNNGASQEFVMILRVKKKEI